MRQIALTGKEALILTNAARRVVFTATLTHPEHPANAYSYAGENSGGGGSRDDIMQRAITEWGFHSSAQPSGPLASDFRQRITLTATISEDAAPFTPRNFKGALMTERPAYPVTIPGFEEHRFLLHKVDELWGVSEARTGVTVCKQFCKRKDAAVLSAETTVRANGKRHLETAIAGYVERFAIA